MKNKSNIDNNYYDSYFISGRFSEENGAWFLRTREGIKAGPFASIEEARAILNGGQEES